MSLVFKFLNIMSPHKGPNIIKLGVMVSTLSIVFIAIAMIPVARKASYWNSCFNNTINWINENEKTLKDWNKAAKESLAVGVCNGALYEPRIKSK